MRYRPYIDGLRAIAVLAVIVFHFDQTALTGGFLGVDIFFVISGFLITQLLSEPLQLTWRDRLREFYLRRARRILPALVVTSLVVALVALWIYFPEDLVRIGKYLLFTPLMLANLASRLDGGYFSTTNAFIPLAHLWSLAVEEQFYLLYPLIFLLPAGKLFALKTLPRRQITIAAVSVAICVIVEHSISTFYLMPARAWELMFGGLAATCPWSWRAGRVITNVVAVACILVTVVSFWMFTENIAFPNLAVMIPCAATGMMLFIGRHRPTAVFEMLSVRPLQFTGKISYSLYLVHAPILAFTQNYMIRALTVGQLMLVGTAVYAVATASWLFIETPVRRKAVLQSDRAFLLTMLVCGAVMMLAGSYLWTSDGLPWRFHHDISVLTQREYRSPAISRCMDLPLDRVNSGDLCRFGSESPGAKTMVLWGDSHALALLPALESIAQSNGMRLMFAARASCRPVASAAKRTSNAYPDQACRRFNDAMASAVQRIRPQEIILAGFWSLDARQSRNTSVTTPTPTTSADSDEWDWNRVLEPARNAAAAVCAVLDVPQYKYPLPYAVAMARRRGIDASFIDISRGQMQARDAAFDRSARALEVARALRIVDPKDDLCPRQRCKFESSDGRSLYRDSNHLSQAGAMEVIDSLKACLRNDQSEEKPGPE